MTNGMIQFFSIHEIAPFPNYWMYMKLMQDFGLKNIKEVEEMPLTIAYGYYDMLLKQQAEDKRK